MKVNREKKNTKERAGAQEKLAVAIADTQVALKRFVSKARQRMEQDGIKIGKPRVAVGSRLVRYYSVEFHAIPLIMVPWSRGNQY